MFQCYLLIFVSVWCAASILFCLQSFVSASSVTYYSTILYISNIKTEGYLIQENTQKIHNPYTSLLCIKSNIGGMLNIT